MSIELDIAHELRRAKDPIAAATRLLQSVDASLLSKEDLISLASFALNAGAYDPLVEAFTEWIRKSPVVPWAQLIELLTRLRFKPDKEMRQKLLEGAEKQSAIELLIHSRSWDQIEPKIKKTRDRYIKDLTDSHRERQSHLKEKLRFLRSQRMIEEEQKVLDQLAHEYPKDEDVAKEQHDLRERWAREVVARAKPAHEVEISSHLVERLSEDEKVLADLWLAELTRRSQRNPSQTYNFAIFFLAMGIFDLAIEMAQKAPEDEPQIWLLAELLYLGGRYIDALDHVHRIEMKLKEDPEASFAVNYIRALCYWKLNQSSTAIELMKGIVSVRPDYRSARSFLVQWNGGLG